jgi:hypothetical protein
MAKWQVPYFCNRREIGKLLIHRLSKAPSKNNQFNRQIKEMGKFKEIRTHQAMDKCGSVDNQMDHQVRYIFNYWR